MPIILGFDDCHIDAWHDCREFFALNGVKATFYVSDLDTIEPAGWEKLRELREDGHCIGFHGLRHCRAGAAGVPHDPNNHRLDNEPVFASLDDFMEREILAGIQIMCANGFDPQHYSYPYGNRTDATDARLLAIFKTVRRGGECRIPVGQEFPRLFGALVRHKALHTCGANRVSYYMHEPEIGRIAALIEAAQSNGTHFETIEEIVR